MKTTTMISESLAMKIRGISTRYQTDRRAALFTLCSVVGVAAMIRVWIAFFSHATWYNSDTYLYLAMAEGIRKGSPLPLSTSGYPLIIAALEQICGGGALPAVLVGLNVVLSTVIVLSCYGVGAALDSRTAGLLAATVAALWPNQLNYTRQILSEVPATFCLVVGVYLLIKHRPLWAGIALCYASFIRAELFPVVPIVFVWMFLARRKKAEIAFFTAGATVIIAFNFTLLTLHKIASPVNAGENLLLAIQSSSNDGIIFNEDRFTPEQKAKPLRTYVAFARAEPGVFIQQRAASLWELWGPWPKTGDEHLARPGAAVSALDRVAVPVTPACRCRVDSQTPVPVSLVIGHPGHRDYCRARRLFLHAAVLFLRGTFCHRAGGALAQSTG